MSLTYPRTNAQDTCKTQEPFVMIPRRFITQIAHTLTAAELRTMLYIFEHTLGYHKISDCISYEQFTDGITTRDGRKLDCGAGVCRRSLGAALSGLETKGLITRHHNAYAPTRIAITPLAAIVVKPPAINMQDLPLAESGPVQASTQVLPSQEETIKPEEKYRAAVVIGDEEVKQLVEIIPGLTAPEARSAITTAQRNARTFQYCLNLALYVTTTPAIHTQAAAFRTLVRQNAERRPAKPASASVSKKTIDYTPGGKYAPGGKNYHLTLQPGARPLMTDAELQRWLEPE